MVHSIQALFYRHATLGGVDAVSEFVIGPRPGGGVIGSLPGDSGALWFWDHGMDPKVDDDLKPEGDGEFRPIAMQWGGRGFFGADAAGAAEFALATSLSSVCKSLQVEVIRDWASHQSRYWGKVGHYKIGNAACDLLASTKAAKLFTQNLDRIAVTDVDIESGDLPGQADEAEFIALADVADLYWRKVRRKDDANHFADMDEPAEFGPYKGKTLLQLWQTDPSSRTAQAWTTFYDGFEPKMRDKDRGALPFRVMQLYDIMVSAVRKKSLSRYICAAGLLAHYVGDACQPLHVSHLHHGFADDAEDDKVHSVYETAMLDRFSSEAVAGVNSAVQKVTKAEIFKGAVEAADAVVQLMQRTVDALPPEDVIDSFNRHKGREQTAKMWDDLGELTIERMADGAHTLALIWQSAWTEGGGDKPGHIAATALKAIPKSTLKRLYEDKSFAESLWLREM